MTDIVLATLNAKYIHSAFGLRYLQANLGRLEERSKLLEFDIHQRPIDIAESLLAMNPRILGLGVYIWNISEITELVAVLKRIRPEVRVILGGPEISYETEAQPVTALADYVITGEADLAFADLCRDVLEDRHPDRKIIPAPLPDFGQLRLPYDFYTDEDIAHRVIYVEASRGCPFSCEFCLSSLDIPVRQVPLEPLFAALDKLLERGTRQFKFVDRTFNLNLAVSRSLLEFFLERHCPGCFYHFEMIPDRLPEGLRKVITRFPSGSLQFEVGIQSFNEVVCELISRRQDVGRLTDNLQFLRHHTGVHVHADLIVGLPGESMESFGAGFDRLVALAPQEIQVGILKRLRGTPITRHDDSWEMVYSAHAPYEVLQTRLIPFAQMQRLRRFARYWDVVANSGNFIETTPLLWVRDGVQESPFTAFLRFSDWLFIRAGRTDAIALARLTAFLFDYLTSDLGQNPDKVAQVLWRDYQQAGRRDPPECVRAHLPEFNRSTKRNPKAGTGAIPEAQSTSENAPSLKRQARHWRRLAS